MRFAGDFFAAAPFKPGLANPNAIAFCRTVTIDQIKEPVTRIDDDGAGSLTTIIRDSLRQIHRIDGTRGWSLLWRQCSLLDILSGLASGPLDHLALHHDLATDSWGGR